MKLTAIITISLSLLSTNALADSEMGEIIGLNECVLLFQPPEESSFRQKYINLKTVSEISEVSQERKVMMLDGRLLTFKDVKKGRNVNVVGRWLECVNN